MDEKDKKRKLNRRSYWKNRERRLEAYRAYYRRHREEKLAKSKAWQKANREKYLAQKRRRYHERKYEMYLKEEERERMAVDLDGNVGGPGPGR